MFAEDATKTESRPAEIVPSYWGEHVNFVASDACFPWLLACIALVSIVRARSCESVMPVIPIVRDLVEVAVAAEAVVGIDSTEPVAETSAVVADTVVDSLKVAR